MGILLPLFNAICVSYHINVTSVQFMFDTGLYDSNIG